MRKTWQCRAASILSFALFLLPLLYVDDASGQGYVDPRVDLGGYKKWCGGVGGTYDYNGGNIRCIPGEKTGQMNYGGYNFGGYNPYEQFFGAVSSAIGTAIGNKISCALDPNCNGTNQQRRLMRERLIEEQRQARLRAEHLQEDFEQAAKERRKKEEDQRLKLDAAKDRMLGVMKGALGSDAFRLKTGDGVARLELKSLEMSSGPATVQERRDCTAYFIQKAEESAGVGNFSEASYLTSQAERMISGEAVDVQCPRNAVALVGVRVVDPIAEDAKVKLSTKEILWRHSRLYGELYSRADSEREEWVTRSDAVDDTLLRVEGARAARDAARDGLEELVARSTQGPGLVPPNVLAEARARLENAADAFRSANEALTEARRGLSRVGKKMEDTHELFNAAARGPDAWKLLIQRLGLDT